MALWLACATTAQAAAPDYTGLAGPAVFLWAIGHPVETLKGLASLRADLIHELLLKRHVKALDVRPQPVNDGKAFQFAYLDGSHIGSSVFPVSSAPPGATAAPAPAPNAR